MKESGAIIKIGSSIRKRPSISQETIKTKKNLFMKTNMGFPGFRSKVNIDKKAQGLTSERRRMLHSREKMSQVKQFFGGR